MSPPPEPTPLTDPAGYLAHAKFSRRLRQCPRTGLSVSYADFGDPEGVPVLFVPPSGCSRWFAAPQDPLAVGYGLRLIVVDRPGVGAVPMVPLKERVDISCKLIVSVLEHLDVKPSHMIATSAGVYCALHLLSTYPSVFLTGLAPPPAVYLVSPWSPPLPASDPLAYQQRLDWIPSALLTTQDLTLPYVIPAAMRAEQAYEDASKAVGAAVGAVSSWWNGLMGGQKAESPTEAAQRPEVDEKHLQTEGEGIPVPDDVQALVQDLVDEEAAAEAGEEGEEGADGDAEETPRRRLWAPSAKFLTTDYLYAEEFRGIGQEHMLCLNRGTNSGPEWFVKEVAGIAEGVKAASKGKDKVEKVHIDVWWGGMDGMVPPNGQQWLNKTLSAHPKEIAFVSHFVEDGSHGDLMLRAQGIGEVYTAIMMKGHNTGGNGGEGWGAEACEAGAEVDETREV